MMSNGYLKKEDGVRTHQRHKRAKVIWLPQAYSVSPTLSDKPLAHPKTIYRNPLCSYVELRQDLLENNKKITRRIEIPKEQFELNSRVIEQTNTALADYDALMRNVDIRLGGKPVYSAQTSMTRIFSRGDMRLGGRFYSSIQNMKAEARKYLRFDGDPVIEIDYSSIHPTMLYDYEQRVMDGDPYSIDGFARSDVKVAFNIMLNRNGGASQTSAAKTIAKEIYCSREDAIAIEQAIIKKHQSLNNYFNSDSGLGLQRKDSKLALYILKHFIQTLKRPIIMIHDSAIVSVRDTESLILTMKAAYETVIKDKHNFSVAFKAIKADSLDFSSDLEELVLRSFEGTLEGDDYKKEYWDTCIYSNPITSIPNSLDVSSYTRASADSLLL
jgi:arsenate reductase-like glutaredoxin family protein